MPLSSGGLGLPFQHVRHLAAPASSTSGLTSATLRQEGFMRVSVVLLVCSVAGILGGGALIGTWALGVCLIFCSLCAGAWPLFHDDAPPPPPPPPPLPRLTPEPISTL